VHRERALDSAQAFQDLPQQVLMDNPQAQRSIRDFQAFPRVPAAKSQGLSQSFARPHVIHSFVEQRIEEAKTIPFRQGTDWTARLGQRVPEVKKCTWIFPCACAKSFLHARMLLDRTSF
jgi:hypothetical protein